MRYPKPGSNVYRLALAMIERGSITMEDAATVLAPFGTTEKTSRDSLYRMDLDGLAIRVGNDFRLLPSIRRYVQMCEGREDPQEAIVPPRTYNAFSPAMTRYEATMRKYMRPDGLQNISHFTSGTSPEPVVRGVIKPVMEAA